MRNIRKYFVALAVMLGVAATATAQTIEFNAMPKGNGISKSKEPMFIGFDGKSVVLVERYGLLGQRLELAAYGTDQTEQARASLNYGRTKTCYGGYINGGHVDLLVSDITDSRMLLYRDRRALTTLEPEDDTLVLASFGGEKGDVFGFMLAVSPNQKLLAGVAVAMRKVQGAEVQVGLYNHGLEEYWTLPYGAANFSDVAVNDDGDVVLYHIGDGGTCRFTILDGEQTRTAEFTLPDDEKVLERHYVRYGNGKIVVAAAVRQENHTVMPIGSNIDRIDIYCYDMAKKTLRVEHHPMADHETHRLSNTREGSTPRHHWVQFGQIDQTMADSTGGYVMVDQSWSVTVDGMPSERHRSGMMLMRVDENGHIQWVHTHRLDINANWRDKAGAAHRWKATPHGVMLAWTDHPGNVTAAPGRAVKTFRPFKAKSVLRVWTVGADGSETEGYMEGGKQALIGSAHPLDKPGTFLALLSGRSKGQLVSITIEQ